MQRFSMVSASVRNPSLIRFIRDPPTSPAPSWREFERELVEVRAHGLSRSEGDTVPGVNAMAAPVFDYNGSIALAITAIGPAGVFDSSWDGPIAGALRGSANQISQRLGAPAIKFWAATPRPINRSS